MRIGETMVEAMTVTTNSVLPPVPTPAMTPEDQICLLLARGQLTPEVRARTLELLAAPLQWPVILERAYSHQVYPLLYRNLRDLGFPGVPEGVQSELKGKFLANALRNQLLAEELARLLNLLGAAGIRVIPLKGVTLAQTLYRDTAARACADIDILVPPADVDRTIELILASGYRTAYSDPFFSNLVRRYGRHHDAVRDDRGISFQLEVHWTLVQHSAKNDDAVRDLWAEASPQTFIETAGFAMSPEWEFLYLCVHAADHEWQSLKWLADIHQMTLCGSADWRTVMVKAEGLELDLVIRQTWAAISLLFGTPIPACCTPATLPAGVQLFARVPFPAGPAESTFAFRHLRVLRRPSDKARYLAEVIFVPKLSDRDFLRLPPGLGFLYYVIRPPRLALKWVAGLLRR